MKEKVYTIQKFFFMEKRKEVKKRGEQQERLKRRGEKIGRRKEEIEGGKEV